MRLTGKTALITGGNSGIGLATARLMLEEGARVAITGRDRATLDAAEAELGTGVIVIQADLNDPEAMAKIVRDVQRAFQTLDILFANAGMSGSTPLGGTTRATFEKIVQTNLTSVFFTVQDLLPLLGTGGAIVLNSSVMREFGKAGTAAYSASKAGISGMAKVFAAELAARGIRVNTVVPGGTRTPIWTRGARANVSMEETEKRVAAAIPMGRLSEAAEIAQAVVFLSSDAASGMTAAEIVVDGGTIGAPAGALVYR